MIVKVLNEVRRRMDEHCENFNRVRKYKKEPKLKNTTIKNTLGINNRLDDREMD